MQWSHIVFSYNATDPVQHFDNQIYILQTWPQVKALLCPN
jgi:hypothetical protein